MPIRFPKPHGTVYGTLTVQRSDGVRYTVPYYEPASPSYFEVIALTFRTQARTKYFLASYNEREIASPQPAGRKGEP